MESWARDARYAVRTLVRNPGFAAVAVVTIALGIGANTAMFSVVRSVLLEPLPYEDPDELVLVWGEMRNRGVTHFPSSPPDFREYRETADLLEGLAGVWSFPVSLTGDGEPAQLQAGGVTEGFFSLLGVGLLHGRDFVVEDMAPNEPGVLPGTPGSLPGRVVLGHALWQQRYGSDPGVVGSTIQLGGGAAEVVGVLKPGFELLLPPSAALPSDIDIWLAARLDFDNAPSNNVFLRPVGRLRAGATPDQLQVQLDGISRRLAADDEVKSTSGFALRVEPLHADLTAHVRPVLLALFGAVVFVLLIACANVSNLLLVRGSSRERELAVRAALGGSRERLARQLMIESGLLALVGSAFGVALAAGGIRALLALQPEDLPRIQNVGIDGPVLAFTLCAATLAALLFGVMPAAQASRVELSDALKERGQATGRARQRLLRNGVVVAEGALSLVLLIGTGLMLRSFVEISSVNPGYDPEAVLTFSAAPPFGTYPEPSDRAAFHEKLQERLESLPGVRRASLVQGLPLAGQLFNGRYGSEEALDDPQAFRQATYRGVLPGYFETLGTSLVAGRTFTAADQVDSASVVVVDERLASTLWPDASPIGERFLIRATTPEAVWVEVIGVVEHQRAETLAADGRETVYFTERYMGSFGGTWVVKAEVDPLRLVPALRGELEALDPDVPLADVRLLRDFVDEAMGPTRFALTLISAFGLTALLLASVGLYGVLSVSVRQLTAEIGVRMAFGARRSSILRMVVLRGLTLTGAGIVIGLGLAMVATAAMESMLVGVTPTDPATFAVVSLVFLLVAGVACAVPAVRATVVDPVTALRQD